MPVYIYTFVESGGKQNSFNTAETYMVQQKHSFICSTLLNKNKKTAAIGSPYETGSPNFVLLQKILSNYRKKICLIG